MRKILPIFLNIVICFTLFFGTLKPVFAAAVPYPSPDVIYTDDPEVNFVGKTAARAVQFLNWTLQNYEWSCYMPTDPTSNSRQCQNQSNPLMQFWQIIRNIIYGFFALIVLVTAFVLIITRGKSLTIQRFLPRFVAVVLLVTLSYSLIQVIYTTTDIFQGFFLTKGTNAAGEREQIDASDLLYVGWNYEDFRGLRKVNPHFDESVFVNLLLARITAVTYYAMTGVLIIRKIILWFFIILSPIFPVLLLYYPVRNTAKIWIGEFFRWLLYAPLFSVFLSGLVNLWKSPRIPLIFNFANVGTSFVYPTATNVLLGGPGQVVTETNNLNTPDTFALYIVALIMLWVVILLPFILLQIFLDYLSNFSFSDSPAMQKILNTSYLLLNKPPPVPVTPLMPGPAGSTGVAKALPFSKYLNINNAPPVQKAGEAKQIPTAIPITAMRAEMNTELLNATSISLPTIRDIANYEKDIISKEASTNTSTVNTYKALQKLTNPVAILNPLERDKFTELKERLVSESRSGNSIANAIISAVNVVNNISNVSNVSNRNQTTNLRKALTNIANPASVISTATEHEKTMMTQLHDSLVKESEQGNTIASTILSAKDNTTIHELQNIKEQLTRESIQGNSIASSVLATSFTKEHADVLHNVLTQVANPETAATDFDREHITQMHDSLVQESQQGNVLASMILSTKDTTSASEIQDIKEQLIQASLQGNQTASSILTTAIAKIDSSTTQKILEKLAKPNNITNTVEREHFEKVKEKLVEAQKQGNILASTILSTMEAPDNIKDMQEVNDQLLEAKEKDQPIASEVLSLFVAEDIIPEITTLPQSNRVQAVSLEDYESVKKMWQENYKNMEVPEGMSTRQAWVNSEINDIDSVLNLLMSDDQEKIQEGMQEVGNILPFLMLGGFSQDEVIAYLKAKKEAGKTVLEEIVSEEANEETMVEEKTTVRAASKTQTQAAEVAEELSPLQSTNTPNITVNTELLQMTNLPLPTIRDLFTYETSFRSGKTEKQSEQLRIQEVLKGIKNPQSAGDEQEKIKMTQIQSSLMQKSQMGDNHAKLILDAVGIADKSQVAFSNNPLTLFHRYLLQLANPDFYPALKANEQILDIHNKLKEEVKNNNILADKILSVTETTLISQIIEIRDDVYSESEAGNALAGLIWEYTPEEIKLALNEAKETKVSLPENNPIQIVNLNDYETVRQMWEEYYNKSELPKGVIDKNDWLQQESESINYLLALFASNDQTKIQEALSQVGYMLPFLLLGGFSLSEITAYLNAKLKAANSVQQSLKEEENKEDIMINANSEQKDANLKTSSISDEATASEKSSA
jgi:hypothetical protein